MFFSIFHCGDTKMIKLMFSLVCNKIFWNINVNSNQFRILFWLNQNDKCLLGCCHIHFRHDVKSFDFRPARFFGLRSFLGVRSKKMRSLANDQFFLKFAHIKGFYRKPMLNLTYLGCPLSVFGGQNRQFQEYIRRPISNNLDLQYWRRGSDLLRHRSAIIG